MALMTLLRTQWDRTAAALAAVGGAAVLLAGWIGVSGTEYVSKQLPYLVSGGLGGVFLLGLSGMLWLSADLRDEWRELRAMRVRLDEQALRSPAPALVATSSDRPAARRRGASSRTSTS